MYDLDKRYYAPQVRPDWGQTHDLQIMKQYMSCPWDGGVLTTWP